MIDSDLTAGGAAAPSRPLSPSGYADECILYATLAVLLSSPLAFGAVQPWARFTLEASAATLLALWTIRQARRAEIRIIGNPVFAPMLAFAAIAVLQLLTGSTAYPYATQSQLALYAAYGTFSFLLVQLLLRTRQIKRFALVLTAYGAALAFFALLQGLSSNGRLFWLRQPRFGGWIYGPYVNHNHYAGLMEMVLPAALAVALSHYSSVPQKISASLAAMLMAITIFLSGSRGGMVAFAIQILILSVVILRHKRNRATLLIGILALLAVALVVWTIDSSSVSRVASIAAETHGQISGGTRLSIDRDAWRMFASRPILGWGLGTFPEVYPQFRTFYTDFRIDQAHNDYLQFMTEMGLPGLVVILWFIAAIYRNASHKLEDWPSNINGSVALAATLAVTGILVHSFVDFNLQIPANAALFYALAAIAAMEPRFGLSRR
jgi:O-antigen ligase